MEESTTVFYERLKKLCRERGISLYNLGIASGTGIGDATIARWKTGTMPRNNTLKALADYFKVDVEYLLGEEDTIPPAVAPFDSPEVSPLDPMERQLLKMYRNSSDIGKARIIHAVVSVWEQDQKR